MNDAPDGLEPRFLKPQNWQWGEFTRRAKTGDERRLRYGYALPEKQNPDCIIVALPGLGEFGEKYYEFAHECLAANHGFFVIDWIGQGLSTRYLDNPQKRHSAGFDEDIDDFKFWVNEHIKPLTKNTPLVMLAHSMGGNIGLHYLSKEPDTFSCAIFSAPMWGIKAVEFMPQNWAEGLSKQMAKFAPHTYVPGGMDWSALHRPKPGFDIFSHDPIRGAVYNQWCLHDPRLQIGSVTNTWLHEAMKSCKNLFDPEIYKHIKTPILTFAAGKETLVSNKAIERMSILLSTAQIIEIEGARHEILMERNDMRDIFISKLEAFIKTHTHG